MSWSHESLAAQVAALAPTPAAHETAHRVHALELELERLRTPATCGDCGARWAPSEVQDAQRCPDCGAARRTH
jgi:predicted Zn-ribbon and HTH transcriptional regulator